MRTEETGKTLAGPPRYLSYENTAGRKARGQKKVRQQRSSPAKPLTKHMADKEPSP